MHHDVLGAIEVDEDADKLIGSLAHNGGRVSLTMRLEGASVGEAIAAGRSVATAFHALMERVPDEMERQLLPVVNGGYLGEGEAPLSRVAMMERATLVAVETDADGNISLLFDDDDMLWGHRIVIDTDLAGKSWRVAAFG